MIFETKNLMQIQNCFIQTDSFSDEEDEFIMAEDNNHAAENEIDQEDIRNLHIDGDLLAIHRLIC